MPTDIEKRFHNAMLQSYQSAKTEAGYNATRFLGMIADHGGLETARTLLHASSVSDGYTALWERQRLDLTVEALVLSPEWCDLFTEQEKNIALRRLADYGYDPRVDGSAGADDRQSVTGPTNTSRPQEMTDEIPLVRTLDQIRENLGTLDSYRRSNDSSKRRFYAELVKRGICFVIWQRNERETVFGASRFVGYASNNDSRHSVNKKKDGRVTNRAIFEVLGQTPKATRQLDEDYARHCAAIGIVIPRSGTFGTRRKYWVIRNS